MRSTPATPRLGLNIDHCATVREARYPADPRQRGSLIEPDPVAFALAAQLAGADGITVHPREDGRHIQRHDVALLKQILQIPLNMEMAATDAMADFALEVRPAHVCIVPEKREEVTTEGGLDVVANQTRVAAITARCREAAIVVSLFIDPEMAQIEAAKAVGAPVIELHTGAFANGYDEPATRAAELKKLREGAAHGHSLGLTVNLGHGINYVNVADLRAIPGIHEMNIGHSIISRALFVGVDRAVREMKALMRL